MLQATRIHGRRPSGPAVFRHGHPPEATGNGQKGMAAKRNAELFELLAERRLRGKSLREAESAAPVKHPGPEAPVPVRTGREIVLGLDTAFVLFMAAGIVIGSAYYLGVQVGRREEARAPRKDVPEIERRLIDTAQPLLNIEGEPLQTHVRLTGKELTLRLRSTESRSREALARLRVHQEYVRIKPLVREIGAPVLILDNGSVYTLTVGLFEARDAPELTRLQAAFAGDPGPPTSRSETPYGARTVAQTGKLGTKVVME